LETIIPRHSEPSAWDSGQESAWIAASQAGDTVAFNRLVLKWERKIYNLSLRMLRNPEDASDSTQEIFLLAFRNIRKFRGNSRFSTWLYRIAVNHCFDIIKRKPADYQVENPGQDERGSLKYFSPGNLQEKSIFQSERQSRILESLAVLPKDQRVVIELKFFQEETFNGISSILDIPESTVKYRYYMALGFLKDHLGRFAEEIL